jgi:putative endonuclease
MSEKRPCVYVLDSKRNGTLYVGVTSDIARRAGQHRSNAVGGFVRDYGVHRLVFVEFHETMADAILREKRIKKWRRTWKLELIERHNRQWRDLYEELALEHSPPVHARGRPWVPACAGTTNRVECRTLIFATR